MLLSIEPKRYNKVNLCQSNPHDLSFIFCTYYKIIIYTVLLKNSIMTDNLNIYLNSEDIINVNISQTTDYINKLYKEDSFKYDYSTDIILNDLYRFVETAILNAKKSKNNIYFSFMTIGNDKIMVAQQQVRRSM